MVGRRQIATITGAMLLGVVLAGVRIYAEHGRFETYHYVALGVTVLMCVGIAVAVIRFANRKDPS